MLDGFSEALRSLLRRPAPTAVAIATLGLGIGVTTSVFSVVERVVDWPLPVTRADRLVRVSERTEAADGTRGEARPPFALFEVWRNDDADFDYLAATSTFDAPILTGLGPAERVRAETATGNFLTVLGARPALGRLLIPDDDRASAPAVAVLSHRFWVARFGSDPQVVGRSVTLDGTAYTVVGVTGSAFQNSIGPQAADDLWLGLGARLSASVDRDFAVDVVGSLRTGVAPERARHGLDALTHGQEVVGGIGSERRTVAVITPLRTAYSGSYRTPLFVMLAAVLAVLMIACASVSSLLLSRAIQEGPMMAIREALGARRGQLVRRVCYQGIFVSLSGGILGVLCLSWLVSLLNQQAGRQLPALVSLSLGWREVIAAGALSLVAGGAASLAPVLFVAVGQTGHALAAGATPGVLGGLWVRRVYDALLVTQVAFTFVLLVGAGLLGRSFLRIVNVDLGFSPMNVVTGHMDLPDSASFLDESVFIQAALDRLQRLHGVATAAIATGTPLHGGVGGLVEIAAHAAGRPLRAWVFGVSKDYFKTLLIPMQRGTPLENARPTAEVVIDETAARRFFPGQDALGKSVTIRLGRSHEWTASVVGVVAATRMSLDEGFSPVVYYPLAALPLHSLFVLARTKDTDSHIDGELRRVIQSIAPDLPVDNISTMTGWLAFLGGQQRFYGLVLAFFGGFALVLATGGVFGSASYGVTRRTREIGLRLALGAVPSDAVWLIVKRAVAAGAFGLSIGVIGAYFAGRVLRSLLYDVAPTDPVVLGLMGLLLIAVCLVASYVPARRAATIDPLSALRSD